MSISGISSTSASTQTSSTKSIAAIKALVEQLNAQSTKSSDTVTISVEALQALLQSQQQQGGPPPMTDEMAAKMGADIQEQNSELFTQLDTDEDGVLSADEAEAGKDAIGQAIQDGTLKPPEKPEGAGGPGGPPPMTDEMAAKMGADIQEQNSELFTQLDTDEDGVLSADEAEAGKDAIDQAIQDGTLQPPEKPEGAGGPPPPPPSESSSSEDVIAQLITILSQQGLSDAEVAEQLGTTEQKVQEVLQAS